MGERPGVGAGTFTALLIRDILWALWGWGDLPLSRVLYCSLSFYPILNSFHPPNGGTFQSLKAVNWKMREIKDPTQLQSWKKNPYFWNFFPGYIVWGCDVVVSNHCAVEGDWTPGLTDPGARPCHVEFSLRALLLFSLETLASRRACCQVIIQGCQGWCGGTLFLTVHSASALSQRNWTWRQMTLD